MLDGPSISEILEDDDPIAAGMPDPADPQAQRIAILMEEYKSKDQYGQQMLKTIVQIAGIGVTAFGAALAYLSVGNKDLHELGYWLLPLAFVLAYALVLYCFYIVTFNSYYLRDLEGAIADIADIPFFHYQYASTRALFSMRSASLGMRGVYILLFTAAVSIYVALVLFGYLRLTSMASPPVPPERITAFLLVQGVLSTSMLAILWASLMGVKPLYETWIKGPHIPRTPPERFRFARLLLYLIVPRPTDLLYKSTIYLLALLVCGLALQLTLASDLVWRALLVFFCVDFLAKQATYIWNEVIDLEKDAAHPHKRSRPLARYGMRNFGKVLFTFRSISAVVAAVALWLSLDLWWVPALVIAIFSVQCFYDRWAKPRGGIWRLGVTAVGYEERAMAGALVAMGYAGSYDYTLLILVLLWTLLYAFLFLSAYWWAEADYEVRYFLLWTKVYALLILAPYWWVESRFRVLKRKPTDKEWFLANGQRVRVLCSIGLFPLSALIVFLYSDAFRSSYPQALLVGSILGICLVTMLSKAKGAPRPRPLWIAATLSVSLLGWRFGPSGSEWIALLLGAPIFLAVLYERLTHEEIVMENLGSDLRALAYRLDELLFPRGRGTVQHVAADTHTPPVSKENKPGKKEEAKLA